MKREKELPEKQLPEKQREDLLRTLKTRFESLNRHQGLEWDTVFVYHNGAESYYSARGFRGSLRV